MDADEQARGTGRRPIPQWHHHPGVRGADELTRGERAADKMRTVMGSWGFVFGDAASPSAPTG